jgi:uncharacterized protein YgiM (DUF1202 family)
MKSTKLLMSIALVALGAWSCAGDEAAPKEPVADASPAIPDSPGDAGETAEKAAGDAGTKEMVEKSQPNTKAAAAAGDVTGDMYVASGALNVRSGPGMKFPSVRTANKGEKVTVSGCEGVWCAIGEKEYVSKTFLSPTAP